jgi:hypothetical protein
VATILASPSSFHGSKIEVNVRQNFMSGKNPFRTKKKGKLSKEK